MNDLTKLETFIPSEIIIPFYNMTFDQDDESHIMNLIILSHLDSQ